MSLRSFFLTDYIMTDGMMSKAATMEIPINSNGDTRTIAEDDGLEQVGQTCIGSWWLTEKAAETIFI